MKRIVTLILAAGLVLGAAFSAQAATEVKAKGTADFEFSWASNFNGDAVVNHNNGNDVFKAAQRFRTQFDFVTSESLSATLFFEIGNQVWGNQGNGASLGTDGVNIETRRAYLDWVIPGTPATVRMGLQGLALPSSFGASAVLDDDVAAVNVSYPINNNFALTAFWARPYDLNVSSSGGSADKNPRWDEVDLFGIVAPITYTGWSLTPWAMFGLIGSDVVTRIPNPDLTKPDIYSIPSRAASLLSLTPAPLGDGQKDNISAWWVGATGSLTMFDPFSVSFDANYGSVDGRGQSKRSGWYAGALAQYKLAMFTPGLYAWYGSGDDSKVSNGSERLPNFSSGKWGYSTFAQNAAFGLGTRTGFTGSPAGNWGVGIQAANISFIDNLSHTVRFAYTQGTNSKNAPANYAGGPVNLTSPHMADGTLYLTNKDNMFEVNFDTVYNIYDNLALAVELGFADLNLSKSVWGNDIKSDTLMRAAVNFQYSF